MPGELEKDKNGVQGSGNNNEGLLHVTNKANTENEDSIPVQAISNWKGQETRVQKSMQNFHSCFGEEATFFVRVPGRYESL
jgi:hypothetical protein